MKKMSSKFISGVTLGRKRTILGEVLPLEMPFLIQIFPVYGCNFKCKYCLHSVPKNKQGFISNDIFMGFDTYKKVIDEISLYNKKLKMLRFAGIGEPLLHNQIAEMISYAKEKEVAENVDIVTNGSLLTKELSQKLINAGLDKLRISIQGVSNEKYEEVSNVKIDLKKLVENIRFFYENKKDTKIYIKIIDCALSNKEEEKKFFEIFESISDEIAIEYLTPTVDEIDYSEFVDIDSLNKTQSGNNILECSICPQPFYLMQINPDGNVVPCCSMEYPKIFGNIKINNVKEIWQGKEFNDFRRDLLNETKNANNRVCKKCKLYKYGVFKEDLLEKYSENLKKVY